MNISWYNTIDMKNDLNKYIIEFYKALGIDVFFDSIYYTKALNNNSDKYKLNIQHNNIVNNSNVNNNIPTYSTNNILNNTVHNEINSNSIQNNSLIYTTENKINDINISNPLLKQLLQEINSIDCLIKNTARNTVVFDGSINSKIMIIGEAPGQEEDIQGKPFVGQSGILLNNMLKSIGLSRQNVIISNVVFWRPPFNRTPSTDEISLCLPYVKRLIQIINPQVLLLLGGVSNHALLNTMTSMSSLRGAINEVLGIKTVSTYHPAYLLRSSTQKKQAFNDFLILKNIIDKLSIV